jgi:hypothetical protein
MTEWFFDPDYSAWEIRSLEKHFSNKRSANTLLAVCDRLQKQLDKEPSKTCAVCFEAVILNAGWLGPARFRREDVWQLLLVIYDRVNFEIKAWIGTEDTIGAKATEIRRQLNSQLLQPGVDALITEYGFDGSLAHTKAAL